MARPRLRALILTAGFGSRLRPLTYSLPKALLPVAGRPVVDHTLAQLARVGCEAAVLNLHHLGERIPAEFGRRYGGMALEYSREAQILGTFGALHAPRQFLADADAVLLINGDSLCRWPLRKIVGQHLKSGADATLLLLKRPPDQSLGGGIGVAADGRIAQMRDLPTAPALDVSTRRDFAGLHVLSPKVLDRVEPRFGDIISDLYQPMLHSGSTLQTMTTGRPWHDLGTPKRYLDAALGALNQGWKGVTSVVSPIARVDASARLKNSAVERGADIGGETVIEDSLILEGARIGKGCRLRRTIVGPGVEIAASSDVENRMMTRPDKRHDLAANESIIGDLLYTSLSA